MLRQQFNELFKPVPLFPGGFWPNRRICTGYDDKIPFRRFNRGIYNTVCRIQLFRRPSEPAHHGQYVLIEELHKLFPLVKAMPPTPVMRMVHYVGVRNGLLVPIRNHGESGTDAGQDIHPPVQDVGIGVGHVYQKFGELSVERLDARGQHDEVAEGRETPGEYHFVSWKCHQLK